VSTFLAHGIAGWTALEVARSLQPEEWKGRRWPWVFATLSTVPDWDGALCAIFGAQNMSFLELGDGFDPHRALTHTLIFAVLAGALVSIPGAWGLSRERWLRRWLWFSCAIALHPVLDYFTANGAGMPFLYPFSRSRFLAPVDLLPIPGYSFSARTLAGLLFNAGTWDCFAWETTILAPFLLAVRIRRARSCGDSVHTSLARPLTIAVFAALFLAACYYTQGMTLRWIDEAHGDVRMPPLWYTIGRAAFMLLQMTLASMLLARGIRSRWKPELSTAARSVSFVIVMLLAISTSGLALRGLHAWMVLASRH
jgi:membrane-bound metal-dependent hydrolase YbcI (DUF457 family)